MVAAGPATAGAGPDCKNSAGAVTGASCTALVVSQVSAVVECGITVPCGAHSAKCSSKLRARTMIQVSEAIVWIYIVPKRERDGRSVVDRAGWVTCLGEELIYGPRPSDHAIAGKWEDLPRVRYSMPPVVEACRVGPIQQPLRKLRSSHWELSSPQVAWGFVIGATAGPLLGSVDVEAIELPTSKGPVHGGTRGGPAMVRGNDDPNDK